MVSPRTNRIPIQIIRAETESPTLPPTSFEIQLKIQDSGPHKSTGFAVGMKSVHIFMKLGRLCFEKDKFSYALNTLKSHTSKDNT